MPSPGHIASDKRERGNLFFTTLDEIASVVLLPRNDIMTQPPRGEEECLFFINAICNLYQQEKGVRPRLTHLSVCDTIRQMFFIRSDGVEEILWFI